MSTYCPPLVGAAVGTALWQHLCREIEQFHPIRLFTSTRENHPDGVRFIEKLGFAENFRHWESRLEPTAFRLADWAGYSRRMAAQGVEIRSVVELKTDLERDRKLYELNWAIQQDIPTPEPAVKESFEEFQKVWERPNLVQDAWFVALDRGAYVGMTEYWSNQSDPGLFDSRAHGRAALAPETGHRNSAEAMRDCLRAGEGDPGTAYMERVAQ